MNQLGLGIAGKPDGLTLGYFTMSATSSITDDPVLKMKMQDVFTPIAAGRGWNVVYARKDIVPGGYTKPADFARATNIFAGGYSRATSHDTRLRLALEIMDMPYKMVTGFQGAGHLNQAMLRGEVNFTGISLPAFQTQVIPQIIKEGIGVVAVPPSGDRAPTASRRAIRSWRSRASSRSTSSTARLSARSRAAPSTRRCS